MLRGTHPMRASREVTDGLHDAVSGLWHDAFVRHATRGHELGLPRLCGAPRPAGCDSGYVSHGRPAYLGTLSHARRPLVHEMWHVGLPAALTAQPQRLVSTPRGICSLIGSGYPVGRREGEARVPEEQPVPAGHASSPWRPSCCARATIWKPRSGRGPRSGTRERLRNGHPSVEGRFDQRLGQGSINEPVIEWGGRGPW
jgi:hypothetical protein